MFIFTIGNNKIFVISCMIFEMAVKKIICDNKSRTGKQNREREG